MTKILLIGNGPNYFSGDYGWQDVIRYAAREVRMANLVEKLIKEPLPIVFEVIASRHPLKERTIKNQLATKMRSMPPNEIHVRLMALKWPTVLTPNYDNCLESASGERFVSENLQRETTYSLFRRKKSTNSAICHIHGDLDGPRTMMLGLHQYAGYLQKLRRYLTTRAGGSRFVFGAAPWAPEDGRHSWVDLFLRHDVHILGFGFDYAETALWWLLGYKQRLRKIGRLPIGATYYYQIGNHLSPDKRLAMMMGLGVTIRPIPSSTMYPSKAAWFKLIETLEKVR